MENKSFRHRGCISTSKIIRAATLQRIPSALAENQRNPLQPEPPRICSRYTDHTEARGGPGENTFFVFPRRLYAAFDARKRPPTPNIHNHIFNTKGVQL